MSESDPELELAEIRKRKIEAMKAAASAPPPVEGTIDVTDDDIVGHIAAHKVALVDCWAPWCAPCKQMAPTFEKLAKKYVGRAAFLKLNTDENQRTAARFAVMGIPTLLLFVDGKLADRSVGALPAAAIEKLIRPHL